jgi:hypothetical protein
MARKKWSELTALQQRAIVVGGMLETVVTVAALRDVARRPSGEIRGPKAAWLFSFLVQPFGPIVYFAAGRR